MKRCLESNGVEEEIQLPLNLPEVVSTLVSRVPDYPGEYSLASPTLYLHFMYGGKGSVHRETCFSGSHGRSLLTARIAQGEKLGGVCYSNLCNCWKFGDVL